MKTLHNTKNCKYRKFLHIQLKHGKISGKFYKFLCRKFPYRINAREVTICVGMVLNGKMTEEKAISTLQGATTELKRQQEMYKSNVECRKKIGWKQINIDTKDPLYESNTTTPYTKPLKTKYLLPKNYG